MLRYQDTVKWGEPWTAQDRMTVLLIPVLRFLGDKVTRSGSGDGWKVETVRATEVKTDLTELNGLHRC